MDLYEVRQNRAICTLAAADERSAAIAISRREVEYDSHSGGWSHYYTDTGNQVSVRRPEISRESARRAATLREESIAAREKYIAARAALWQELEAHTAEVESMLSEFNNSPYSVHAGSWGFKAGRAGGDFRPVGNERSVRRIGCSNGRSNGRRVGGRTGRA